MPMTLRAHGLTTLALPPCSLALHGPCRKGLPSLEGGPGDLLGLVLPTWREAGRSLWGPGAAANQPCSPLQFFASMLTYPFVLVSNLMAVNNCG